jgi:hypothetical protein
MQFVGDKVAYALAQGLKVVTGCVGDVKVYACSVTLNRAARCVFILDRLHDAL